MSLPLQVNLSTMQFIKEYIIIDISAAFNIMRDSISCFLTMNVIQKRDGNLRKRIKVKVGKIKMSFVDIQSIIAGDEKYLSALKETVADDLYKQKDSNEKYTKDLFYISPLFYKKFSKKIGRAHV